MVRKQISQQAQAVRIEPGMGRHGPCMREPKPQPEGWKPGAMARADLHTVYSVGCPGPNKYMGEKRNLSTGGNLGNVTMTGV